MEMYLKDSQDLIVMAKNVYDEVHEDFKKDKTMEPLLPLLEPLKIFKSSLD